MKTSKRLGAVQPSLTLEIATRAKQLRRAGHDVISLAAGEPDFFPPSCVAQAAVAAIERGEGRYTAVAGMPELRHAIARRLEKDQGQPFEADSIIVTSGAKQAIFNALYVLCDAGDEVIILRPYWTSYPEIAGALGIVPVFCDTRADDGYRLDPESVARQITPRTRAIILNFPNNPTGAVATPGELAALAEVLRDHPVWILSDEIYDKLVYRGTESATILGVAPELRDRTIVVNGLSKTYCMTGWRIGYAAGPKAVIRDMETIQGHTTSCANAIAQAASVAALDETDPAHLDMMIGEYERRAAFVQRSLCGIEGVVCPEPRASFYAFPRIDAFFGSRYRGRPMTSGADVAAALLEEGHVATVPGIAFGFPAALRLSYATSMAQLEVAMQRVETFFGELDRA